MLQKKLFTGTRHISKYFFRNAINGWREDLFLKSVNAAGCDEAALTNGTKDKNVHRNVFFYCLAVEMKEIITKITVFCYYRCDFQNY